MFGGNVVQVGKGRSILIANVDLDQIQSEIRGNVIELGFRIDNHIADLIIDINVVSTIMLTAVQYLTAEALEADLVLEVRQCVAETDVLVFVQAVRLDIYSSFFLKWQFVSPSTARYLVKKMVQRCSRTQIPDSFGLPNIVILVLTYSICTRATFSNPRTRAVAVLLVVLTIPGT